MYGTKQWILPAVLIVFLLAPSYCAFAQVRPGTSTPLGNSQRAGLKGDALIQYDAETNSLVIVTDEDTNEEIGKVIEALDKPVPQVLIKVLFLEVTHTNDLKLGVEFKNRQEHAHTEPWKGTHVNSETIQTIFGLADQSTGAFYHIIDQDLEATIHALAEVTKLEVLSRPSILTRNNQQAVITVGKRVPFIQNSRITYEGQTINTVTYDDIGIILQVTPHITDDRVVSMDVTPEISTLTGETVPISSTVNAPVFATRSAQTGVVVPDGKTVVIGGLMEDSKTKDKKKVPVLGSIPVLGALFSRKSDEKSKTELLIFLTPHVIENSTELESVSGAERKNAPLSHEAFSDEDVQQLIGTRPTPAEEAQPVAPAAGTIEDAQPVAPDANSARDAQSTPPEASGKDGERKAPPEAKPDKKTPKRKHNKGVVYNLAN